MTKDRTRKQALRAAAGSDGYARTARLYTSSTEKLHRDLAAAFTAAGWPVEMEETFDEGGSWHLYPGPASVTITRGFSSDPDYDPDDPHQADLTEPPTVWITAPAFSEQGPEPVAIEVTAHGISVTDLVERAARELAAARARVTAQLTDDAACPICGDHYPRAHLLDATASTRLAVCPACVFDGDLLADPFPEQLALQFDRLAFGDLAVPAGWSAVAALLAYASGPNLWERLHRVWSENHVLEIPLRHWRDPGKLWIWLPTANRPTALAQFGPGASLDAVAAAVDSAHPGLHEAFRKRLKSELDGDPEEPGEDRNYLVPELWNAVIAYACSFAAQAEERPAHRAPWHVSESFDELDGHFRRLGSTLDADDLPVIFTLRTGIEIVCEALGWREPSIWSDLEDDLDE